MSRRTALVAVAFVALVAALQPAHDAVGAGKNKAGLVVRNGDGTVDKMCVFFDETSISGLDLLARSGTTYVAEKSALGSAICKIDAHGCAYPSEDCFCEYPKFWGYWVRDPGESAWTFASTGSADHEVRNGSVNGWSLGENGKPAPPDVPFAEVCPASAKGNVSGTKRSASSNAGGSSALADAPVARTRPNYTAFAGFALLFALLAGGAAVLRRRRSV